MIEIRAYTRITLALDIVRRLSEGPLAGYHEIKAVKHQIDLHDTVRVEEADRSSIRCNPPDGVPQDETNVCLRAVRLFQRWFGIRREVAVEITKRIPVMGGLAGGSADAAATVIALCRLWGCSVPLAKLAALGRELGMDVPYFFVGGTALDCEAVGYTVPIATPLVMDFVLVVPSFGVPTREAYAGIDYSMIGRDVERTAGMVAALEAGDRQAVARTVHNDFTATVFRRYPILGRLTAALTANGCDAAWMSGSGSTVVGLAHDSRHAQAVAAELSTETGVARVLCCRTLDVSALSDRQIVKLVPP